MHAMLLLEEHGRGAAPGEAIQNGAAEALRARFARLDHQVKARNELFAKLGGALVAACWRPATVGRSRDPEMERSERVMTAAGTHGAVENVEGEERASAPPETVQRLLQGVRRARATLEEARAAAASSDKAGHQLRVARQSVDDIGGKMGALGELVEAVAREDADAPEGDANPQVISEMRRLLEEGQRRIASLMERAGAEDDPGRRSRMHDRATAQKGAKEIAQLERRLQAMSSWRRQQRAVADMDRALLAADRVLQRIKDGLGTAGEAASDASSAAGSAEARVPPSVQKALEFVAAAAHHMRD
jgi:hypothetical protein